MSAIRGNASGEHGAIACLRCKYIDNEIAKIEEELETIKNNAALHFAQVHTLVTDDHTPNLRPIF
jgi:hypothetical protein